MKHQRVVSDVQATMILATTLLLLVQWQRVSSINAMWCAYISLFAAGNMYPMVHVKYPC